MKKQFIITDPCYIMDEQQYDKICSLFDIWKKAAYDIMIDVNLNSLNPFEYLVFPFASFHDKTKNPILFHHIEGTPNGDGGYIYSGQEIGVDSGMLCIAECDKGWKDEKLGATFDTLNDARGVFSNILNQF